MGTSGRRAVNYGTDAHISFVEVKWLRFLASFLSVYSGKPPSMKPKVNQVQFS